MTAGDYLRMDYLGTGLIAFLGIAVWDTVRMLIQTWWIKRSLNNNVPVVL